VNVTQRYESLVAAHASKNNNPDLERPMPWMGSVSFNVGLVIIIVSIVFLLINPLKTFLVL
jgi:hypothetical protein